MGAQPDLTNTTDDTDLEPSSIWKSRLKTRIEQNLDFLIQDAREALHDAFASYPSSEERKRLQGEFERDTAQLRVLAEEQYMMELRKEREERKILRMKTDQAVLNEQQALLDAIKRKSDGERRYASVSSSSSMRGDTFVPAAGPSHTSSYHEEQWPPPTQGYPPSTSTSSTQSTSTTTTTSTSSSSTTTSSSHARHLAQQELYRQRAEAIQRRRAEEKLNDQRNWAESIAAAFPAHSPSPSLDTPSPPPPSPPPAQANTPLDADETLTLLLSHEQLWSLLSSPTSSAPLTWSSFPWPVLSASSPSLHELTLPRVTAYVKAPYTLGMAQPETERERVKEMLRRWHPDRFEVKFLKRVREAERMKVREGAGVVVRVLNELLGRIQ